MPTTPTRAEMYDRSRKHYELHVAGIAASLRRMADDVERAGARLGHVALGDMPHSQAAGYVIQAASQLHNLHLGDLVRVAAEADRYHPDLDPATHTDGVPNSTEASVTDPDAVAQGYRDRIATDHGRRPEAEGTPS